MSDCRRKSSPRRDALEKLRTTWKENKSKENTKFDDGNKEKYGQCQKGREENRLAMQRHTWGKYSVKIWNAK